MAVDVAYPAIALVAADPYAETISLAKAVVLFTTRFSVPEDKNLATSLLLVATTKLFASVVPIKLLLTADPMAEEDAVVPTLPVKAQFLLPLPEKATHLVPS